MEVGELKIKVDRQKKGKKNNNKGNLQCIHGRNVNVNEVTTESV